MLNLANGISFSQLILTRLKSISRSPIKKNVLLISSVSFNLLVYWSTTEVVGHVWVAELLTCWVRNKVASLKVRKLRTPNRPREHLWIWLGVFQIHQQLNCMLLFVEFPIHVLQGKSLVVIKRFFSLIWSFFFWRWRRHFVRFLLRCSGVIFIQPGRFFTGMTFIVFDSFRLAVMLFSFIAKLVQNFGCFSFLARRTRSLNQMHHLWLVLNEVRMFKFHVFVRVRFTVGWHLPKTVQIQLADKAGKVFGLKHLCGLVQNYSLESVSIEYNNRVSISWPSYRILVLWIT